jgi:ubiquinone/menaquinone biosynthesis C-methylase UbiE
MGAMSWRGWRNAEIYDRFVREHRIYRTLNQRLVELSELQDARRVLDLGCGTGATALACLRVLDMDTELVGVDASEEMVEVARANILDPRASFVVCSASSLEGGVQGTFDRAVCNAAFWQFPAPDPVLAALATVMVGGGLFVFNIPSERVEGEEAPVHPFQVALARAIESRTGRPYNRPSLPLQPSLLERLARESGFTLERVERFHYRGKQAEFMELMQIPAMIRPLTADLPGQERLSILAEAAETLDPEEPVEVPWIYFVLRFG